MTDLFFPSEDHRRALVDKVEAGGLKALDDLEKREFHAYRYAWRRVRLADFSQKYGGDPRGDWFDGVFVNQAVEMMTGGKYSLTPPRPQQRPDPTPEDIAYVDRRLVEFRANLAVAERTPTTTRRTADPRDLAAIQRGLGLSATEINHGEAEDGKDAAE
jgi:hypothetical protein